MSVQSDDIVSNNGLWQIYIPSPITVPIPVYSYWGDRPGLSAWATVQNKCKTWQPHCPKAKEVLQVSWWKQNVYWFGIKNLRDIVISQVSCMKAFPSYSSHNRKHPEGVFNWWYWNNDMKPPSTRLILIIRRIYCFTILLDGLYAKWRGGLSGGDILMDTGNTFSCFFR